MSKDYKPKFKDCFRLEIDETEGVFLLSERTTALLSDPIYIQLAPLLDGDRTIDEIVKQLQDRLPAPYIYYGLSQLKNQGYLSDREVLLPPALQIFCDRINISAETAYDRLQTTKVSVKAIGSITTSELISTLESHQIQISENADLEIVLCDDYLQLDLAALNQAALQKSRPWLLVKPVGTTMWLGPLFYPRKTGCWECLAQRLRCNRPIAGYLGRRTNKATPPIPPLAKIPGVLQTAFGMTATEVLKWIVQNRENKRLEGVLIAHDALTLETKTHILTKRPQCPVCGISKSQQSVKPLPLILGSRKKKFVTEGGHRCNSPEATLKQYQHHISPIAGIIRELQKLPDSVEGCHNYVAKHHFLSMFDDLRTLTQNIGGRSGGKGKTEIQARVSAFGEAIERYSGVFQGDEIRTQGSYQQLGDRAIHPNACMNFSPSQYRDRHTWNASCQSLTHKVPEPFDETNEIEWTPVWSLTQQEFKYLPTAYCYFGYPKPPKPDCWADTNGCAAGNTLEEAILQGLMELVERDSVALWWYNRIPRLGVDLDSFDEPYFHSLQQSYQSIHRDLWVLDITSDLKIPTFVAVSRCGDRDSEDILLGFGAHFDAKLAVGRALTELNQLLGAVLPTNAEGKTQYASSADPLALNWWQTATVQNQPYLVPDARSQARVYADYSQNWSEDLLEDIKSCQQILEKKGMELLVLDQTRPDIGLKVVKVIVPGMRHFWKRLGPGRLYNVPVEMGWLKEAPLEENLNPLPLWL